MKQCRTCARWWHGQCVGLQGLKDAELAMLKNWDCPLCLKLPQGVEREIVSLTKADIEGVLQPLMEEIKSVKAKVMPKDKMKEIVSNTVEKGLSEKLEHQTNTWNNVLQENREQTSQAITDTISRNNTRVINEVISNSKQQMDADARERDLRKCNVVINDFPESTARLATDKIKHDRHYAQQILGIDDDEIVKVRRGGPLKEGERRPRSLIVTVVTPDLANNLHDYGRGVRRVCTTERNLAYWVNPDLIKVDRDANYRARLIARERARARQRPRGMTVIDNLSPVSSRSSGHRSRTGPPGVSPAATSIHSRRSSSRNSSTRGSVRGSPAASGHSVGDRRRASPAGGHHEEDLE